MAHACGALLRRGVLALGVLLVLGTPARTQEMPPLPEAVWDQLLLHTTLASGSTAAPGRLPAHAPPAVQELFFAQSKARHLSYEILFPQQRMLGLAVFALALHAGDVPRDTKPQRFFKGVQGFHYSVAQVCAWRADLPHSLKGLPPESAQAALWLARLLEEDQVIHKVAGKWQGTGGIVHVLGAARGEKRSLARNLRHERLHVLWDEDQDMRKEARAAWEALLPTEQEKAVRALQGYAADKALLLEEWAVRRLE